MVNNWYLPSGANHPASPMSPPCPSFLASSPPSSLPHSFPDFSAFSPLCSLRGDVVLRNVLPFISAQPKRSFPPGFLSGEAILLVMLIPPSLPKLLSSSSSSWSHHPGTSKDPQAGTTLPRHHWALLDDSYGTHTPHYSSRGSTHTALSPVLAVAIEPGKTHWTAGLGFSQDRLCWRKADRHYGSW